MMTRPQTTKQLQELRARTDRQLIAWIDRRLKAGLRSYGTAAEEIYLEVARSCWCQRQCYRATRLEAKLNNRPNVLKRLRPRVGL